jgi:uncharacterized protein (DUF1684 family)
MTLVGQEKDMSSLSDFRHAKDEFMGRDHQSPLTQEQRVSFAGLSYYDDNRDLRLELDVRGDAMREPVEMQTSTGDVASFSRWGTVEFDVDGETARLTVYKEADGDEFFLPFADATSGSDTYGAGRYLDVQELKGGKLLVDFNYAYSPYCAYNERWSCPLTPSENRMRVPIRAGEKSFK